MEELFNPNLVGSSSPISDEQADAKMNLRLTYTVPPTRHRRSYKPAILRAPCMLFVFALTLALIGLLEFASRELPHADKGHHSPLDKVQAEVSSLLHKRQDATTTAAAASTRQPLAEIAVASAYVSTKIASTADASGDQSGIIAFTAAQSAYVPPETSTTDGGAYVAETSIAGVTNPLIASRSYVPTGVTSLATAAGSKYVSTRITVQTTETGISTSSLITTNAQGKLMTITTAVPFTTVKSFTTATVLPVQDNKGLLRVTILTWPLWKVFVGSYLPVLTAIIFRVFWTSIYNKVKLIEPFTRMARHDGAVAAETLHTYYLSTNLTPDPIVSFFKGHWLIFWASLTYTVTALLPALSTEAIFLDTNYQCANPGTGQNPCWPPKLSVDPIVIRWLQGLLGFVAVMTLSIMIMLLRARTGLYQDPSSIGSIATLMHHPEVLADFRSFGDEVQLKDMRRQLGNRRYKLDDYQRPDGTWRYGFVPVNASITWEWNEEPKFHKKPKGVSQGAKKTRRINALWDVSFLFFLIGVLGVLVAYFKSSGSTGFNNFFNGNSFGPRFFMAAMATIVSLNWKRLEREVHTLTPYHRLARSPAPASSTVLLRKRSLPFTAFFAMIYHNHFFAASLALTAILADILVISLAGVPYSPGQIWLELIVCSYMSMAVLGVMIISLIALLFWRRRSPDLPRAPDTVLGVMSYVADSKMLEDFDGCEVLKNKDMDDRIDGLGKRYGYGKFVGADAQMRWMVDEEFRLQV